MWQTEPYGSVCILRDWLLHILMRHQMHVAERMQTTCTVLAMYNMRILQGRAGLSICNRIRHVSLHQVVPICRDLASMFVGRRLDERVLGCEWHCDLCFCAIVVHVRYPCTLHLLQQCPAHQNTACFLMVCISDVTQCTAELYLHP